MSLSEKLQRQQLTQSSNRLRLMQHGGRDNASNPSQEKSEFTTSASEIAVQLERLRHLQRAKATREPAIDRLIAPELGGEVRENSEGCCLVFRKPYPTLGEAEVRGHVLGLCGLLTGQTVADGARVLLLDTETTGLSGGAGTHVFLAGLGFWDESGFVVEQYFMRDFHEERAMLADLAQRLGGTDLLLSFNGKSFDLPLLQSRFILSRLPWPLSRAVHLDLLYPARRLWRLRLRDCSLGNLEKELFGRERIGDVPGHLIPHLYFNFARTGVPRGMSQVLEHNRQDICTLVELCHRMKGLLASMTGTMAIEATDLFSAGKYLRSLGQTRLSFECHRAALNSLNGQLDPELECRVLTSIAELHLTEGQRDDAVALWERALATANTLPLRVAERLAVHYEHRVRKFRKALEISERALESLERAGPSDYSSGPRIAEWTRRRERLLRKIAKLESGPARGMGENAGGTG
ncbi:MAG: ribonuclease H-like domain-containing protein [Acidobacteriota bacterium]